VATRKAHLAQRERGPMTQLTTERPIRILLDASSLIDAERGKSVPFHELGRVLREHNAQLVLTRTNVLEFSASAAKTGDFLAIRHQLQQIEALPVTYLREGGITPSELKEAIAAFNEKREFVPVNPYVQRWDETLVLEGPSPAQMLVNQRLDDLVFMLWKQGALSLAERRWGNLLKRQFGEDRGLPAKVRKDIKSNFPKALRRHLAQYSIAFPEEKVDSLADWVYYNPARCPGHRVAYDIRHELMNNLREAITENDISDIAQAEALPYVDAITMDRNTADLCRRVVKRLKAKNSAINYQERVFTNLAELVEAKLRSLGNNPQARSKSPEQPQPQLPRRLTNCGQTLRVARRDRVRPA
jgi:hypothetical protein